MDNSQKPIDLKRFLEAIRDLKLDDDQKLVTTHTSAVRIEEWLALQEEIRRKDQSP